jgi:hypothetical protein
MISKRREDALELRLAGVDNLTIGRKLAADPTVNSDGQAYPCGYGRDKHAAGDDPPDDRALQRLVADDINDGIRDRAQRMTEGYEQLKQVQEARIERLLASLWAKALKGDLFAMDRITKLLERQARLHGLDAPTRQELSGPEGGAIEVKAIDEQKAAALAFLSELSTTAVQLTDEDAGALIAAEELAELEAGDDDAEPAELVEDEDPWSVYQP